jgi:hypothetical protein
MQFWQAEGELHSHTAWSRSLAFCHDVMFGVLSGHSRALQTSAEHLHIDVLPSMGATMVDDMLSFCCCYQRQACSKLMSIASAGQLLPGDGQLCRFQLLSELHG